MQTRIRVATIEDCQPIAELMDLAGNGLPRRIWESYCTEQRINAAYLGQRTGRVDTRRESYRSNPGMSG